MSFFNPIINDLRERKLWPVAVALLVALVAVPMLLSKSTPAPAPPSASAAAAANPATAVPAVNVSSAVGSSRLTGHARDPFAQQKGPKVGATVVGSTAAIATGTASAIGATGGAGGATGTAHVTGGAGASTGSGGSAPSAAPQPSPFPATKPKPAPSGLSPTEAYHVTMAITVSGGGLDTMDPVERLAPFPSDKQPLLVELGVLQGGRQVLFAVQPGTVVSGPGTCTPGTIDCEVLSLAPGDIETLSTQSPAGVVTQFAQFAVTGVTTDHYPTAAAADRARRQVSAAGQRLLDQSALGALSLFKYTPSLGAIVDLRNLTVGGS